MKVFISHQKADTELAASISHRLRTVHQIDSYLDVIDPVAQQAGDELGEHIRAELGRCTQLLAVVSSSTKSSWWVPWEIGIATEKDQPIATYAGESTPLPEYLKKWPYLRSNKDLDEYAAVSKSSSGTYRVRKGYLNEEVARRSSTAEFHKTLRARLGQ
ncbi:toll/interleukin-1 receptor domain-containing protein [Microvirga roseola]|uniref:toll/interleukin-1 receptor domain-containing protein n=1 Tax=Microvirga roseola TaxID=2883126 RepID=UPI001E4C8230|nr:toll/interleukin-1 receptor domain-containing protein [Microvirga roseola]